MSLTKKKLVILFLIFVILFPIFLPSIYGYGAEIENSLENEVINSTEVKNEENLENIIAKNENIEQEVIENTQEINNLENETEDKNEFEVKMNEDIGISVAAVSGTGTRAGNEDEFRNAFYNSSVSELTTSDVIRLNSIYTVNHNIRINSSSTSGGNALHLSQGCGIVVESGCTLTLEGMVIDGRTFSNNDGKSCITVKNGATLMLTEHSIIDGGTGNWGINVEDGGQLLIVSAQISYCDRRNCGAR